MKNTYITLDPTESEFEVNSRSVLLLALRRMFGTTKVGISGNIASINGRLYEVSENLIYHMKNLTKKIVAEVNHNDRTITKVVYNK